MTAISSHREKRTPGRPRSGFTLIELMMVVGVISIVVAIAVPLLQTARNEANAGSAIAALRTISSANEQYRIKFGSYPTSLNVLMTLGYIDTVLGSGTKSDYVFDYTGLGSDFEIEANPLPSSGDRYFFVDATGVIRFSTTGVADSSDTPIN